MKNNVSSFSYPVVIILAFLFLFVDIPYNIIDIPFVKDAEARATRGRHATGGRHATKSHVGDVHDRRRTRRAVRRAIAIGTRVTVLPAGCTTVIRHGVRYSYCGEVYYRPYYEGTTVIYVVEQP